MKKTCINSRLSLELNHSQGGNMKYHFSVLEWIEDQFIFTRVDIGCFNICEMIHATLKLHGYRVTSIYRGENLPERNAGEQWRAERYVGIAAPYCFNSDDVPA